MKNIDKEIERILNKEYKEQINENETVNFVSESLGLDKSTEHISFEDDRNRLGEKPMGITPREENIEGNRQGDSFKSNIFSQKPFTQPPATVPEEVLVNLRNSNIGLIDLEVLLGLSRKSNGSEEEESNGGIQPKISRIFDDVPNDVVSNAVKKPKLVENTSEDHRHKIEEMNQFIDDLFSNKYLEKRVFEHQKQSFSESLFGAPNLSNEYRPVHSRASNVKQSSQNSVYQEMDRMSHNSILSSFSPHSSDNSNMKSITDESKTCTKPDQLSAHVNKNEHFPNIVQGCRYPPYNSTSTRPSIAPDCLLFRNPTLRQNSFNPQAYCKVKRRRRISSNTWCSAGNLLAFHPSKLSSFEFVRGNMSLTPKPIVNPGNFVFTPKQSSENDRMIENFKKQMNRIDFDNITVHELKSIMKDYGLNPNGKKKEMIDRLRNTLKEVRTKHEERQPNKITDCREDPLYEKYFF
ncbi:uncharacterized protein VICG_01454 [Vittaforma corneae ATCC 50505]|uniref:SAP domain-containing protein n=1 Tax=Vittaforma corneae (strain ATCC 50505) TaxID=993615 RepID=L2GLT8_VITCO|nr:uncharacterized protein VICG_01454 [Vittaforma corneae ATCC 50505]ELA41470.1 hypothetical protein VICG_01454 [Vittaforma corneae ATCC 50505]